MNAYIFTSIMVMAAVTYLVRMTPLTLMRSRLKSRFLRSVLAYAPYAVLAAMTIPHILYSTNSIWSAAAGLVAAVILAMWNKSLLTVALGASAAVFIVEILEKTLDKL